MSQTLHAGEQRTYGASHCAGTELMPQELEVVSGGFFGRLIRRAGRAISAIPPANLGDDPTEHA